MYLKKSLYETKWKKIKKKNEINNIKVNKTQTNKINIIYNKSNKCVLKKNYS